MAVSVIVCDSSCHSHLDRAVSERYAYLEGAAGIASEPLAQRPVRNRVARPGFRRDSLSLPIACSCGIVAGHLRRVKPKYRLDP